MSDDLTFSIGSTTDDGGLRAAARGLDNLADTADHAGEQLDDAARAADGLGDQARQSSRGVDDLGDAADNASRDLDQLQRKIAAARVEMAALARTFASSGGADDYKRFRQAASDISKMQRAAAVLGEEVRQSARAADDLGDELDRAARKSRTLTLGDIGIGAAGNALQELSLKIGLQVAGAIAAPVIPALAGAVSAGVLLGVGGGALAAGIAAAAGSAEVQDAWKQLAADAGDQFASIGNEFRGPVLEAIGDIRTEIRGMDLAGVLEPAVDLIGPMTDGLLGLVRNALPGLEHAIEASVEPMETLAEKMPRLGKSVSEMLEGISLGAGGASRALEDLLNTVELTLVGTGQLVGRLSQIYELADKAGLTGLLGQLDHLGEKHGTLVKLGEDGSTALHNLGGAADEADSALSRLQDEIRGLSAPALDWAQAEIAVENATRSASEALKESNGSLDVHTAKGAQAREAVLGLAEAANRAVTAKLAETGSIVEASDVYAGYRAQLIATMIGAGVARAEAERLAAAWLQVPESVQTNYHIVTTYTQRGTPPASLSYGDIPTGRIGGYSRGGPVVSGGGIRDDVLALLKRDEWVLTTEDVDAMGGRGGVEQFLRNLRSGGGDAAPIAAAGGRGTASPPVLRLAPAGMAMPSPRAAAAATSETTATLVLASGGSQLEDLLLEVIRVAIDRGGGNVQTVLGRRGA